MTDLYPEEPLNINREKLKFIMEDLFGDDCYDIDVQIYGNKVLDFMVDGFDHIKMDKLNTIIKENNYTCILSGTDTIGQLVNIRIGNIKND